MNFLVLILDTLRYDHLGCNGRRPVRTPNFDRFAEGAVVFDRCYAGSYPSQPHRCDCAAGRFVYPFYGWQEMPPEETHLVPLLAEAGYRTHLVADGGLPFNLGLARGFQTGEQITDRIDPDLVEATPWPCDPAKSRIPDQLRRQWALRTHRFKEETDWPQPRVMSAAADWMERSRGDGPLLLWVESWRIHESWIDPQAYVDLYDPDYAGEVVALPAYSPTLDYLTPEELNHVRALYAASVTFTDKWFGRLLERLEAAGLADETCLVVSADHGWSLGDHGRTGKHAVPNPPQDPWPLYEECTRVPLMVRLPGAGGGRRSAALVQHADLLPTVLDLAGLADRMPETVRGTSWGPILRGEAEAPARNLAVTSSYVGMPGEAANTRTTVTTPEWTLILPCEGCGAELYHLGLDPGQTLNLFDRHRPRAREILAAFVGELERLGADPAKIEAWRETF